MPAGRLRLAATAGVDAWITGDATYSHFLQRFKRHTKFAIETVETRFDGRVDFDGEVSCRVPVTKGDLIRNVALKIVLSDPTPVSYPNLTLPTTLPVQFCCGPLLVKKKKYNKY